MRPRYDGQNGSLTRIFGCMYMHAHFAGGLGNTDYICDERPWPEPVSAHIHKSDP